MSQTYSTWKNGAIQQDTLDAAQADAESVVVDRLSSSVEERVNCCVPEVFFFCALETYW